MIVRLVSGYIGIKTPSKSPGYTLHRDGRFFNTAAADLSAVEGLNFPRDDRGGGAEIFGGGLLDDRKG